MSSLACISRVMSGSGLEELLEVMYVANTVIYMLSGEALVRAVRGHLLVDFVLNAMISAKALNVILPEVDIHAPQNTIDTIHIHMTNLWIVS